MNANPDLAPPQPPPLQSPLPPPVQRGMSARGVIVAALALLVLGAVGGLWAAIEFRPWAERLVSETGVSGPAASGGAPPPAPPAAALPPPVRLAPAPPAAPLGTVPGMVSGGAAGDSLALPGAELAARVAGLEQRLAQIAVAAEAASGNAGRAEGLLIAFAARRALDRGLPLGYLEAQLLARFGDAQPNAVKQIVETARAPVTLDQLQGELDQLMPRLASAPGADGGWLAALRGQAADLFILRPASEGPSRPSDRLARAKRLLDAGLVDGAIAEVQRSPGAAAAADWLTAARRYHEARRALDVIDSAAILDPGQRGVPDAGRPAGLEPERAPGN